MLENKKEYKLFTQINLLRNDVDKNKHLGHFICFSVGCSHRDIQTFAK